MVPPNCIPSPTLARTTLACALFVLLSLLTRLSSADPPKSSSAADLTEQAARHMGRGDYDIALLRLTQALRLDPTHAPAWRLMGNAREKMGDLREALRAYDAGIERVPSSATLLRDRARALEKVGRIPDAMRDLQTATQLDPMEPDIRQSAVEFYERIRAWSAALQEARAVVVALRSKSDHAAEAKAKIRVAALMILAAETDTARAHIRTRPWERRSLGAIAGRLIVP